MCLRKLRESVHHDQGNALAICPLAAGIAAVDRIRPLGGEGFSASFADPVLPFGPALFHGRKGKSYVEL